MEKLARALSVICSPDLSIGDFLEISRFVWVEVARVRVYS